MRALLMRLSALIRRRTLDAELEDEIAAHVDFATADHIASGLSPEDARRKAALAFGGRLQTQEAYRDREGFPFIEHLVQDVAHAVRILTKHPILLVTTTVSIALGVGVNIAAFSLLRTILFEPGFTANAPSELFHLDPGLSYPNYVDLRASEAFAGLAAAQSSTLTYRNGDTTTTISARIVSDNFFDVLGLRAQYGRTFGTSDGPRTIKDPSAIVVSYAFWLRLGGDQTVIGRTVYLNGWPYVIAGVLPREAYSIVFPLVAPSVYVQLGPRVNVGLDARQAAQFDVLGRLQSGTSRAQASAALRIAALDLEQRFPDSNAALSRTVSIAPVGGLIQRLNAGGARIAYTLASALYGLVGLVLLVACANVAGVLLARVSERAREVGIRVALGASRARLVQQFLAESLVIATVGCVAGAMLWLAITKTVPSTPLLVNAGIDLIAPSTSLLQCGLLVVVVTLACGIAPALAVNQHQPALARHDSVLRRRPTTWSSGRSLVAAQVGVAFIVLVGACSLLLIVVRQQLADPGFDLGRTVSIEARWPTTSNGPDFFEVRDRLHRVPGVEAVSSGTLPVGLIAFTRVHRVDGVDDAGWSVEVARVGPRYLTTMGIQLLRGRDFSDEDVRISRDLPVPVIVGDTFARRYLGSIDVIDRQLVLPRDSENGTRARRLQIVGVSRDSGIQVFGGDPVPVLFFPALSPSFAVRVNGEPTAVIRELERAITALEPGAALSTMTMTTRLSRVLLPVRIATLVLGMLGILGLGLAMTGLYGMVSYAAQLRRMEIGVRMALGATRSAVLRLVLRDAIVTVGAGSAVGGLLSFAVIRALGTLLGDQQSATTPVAVVAVLLLTMIVGLIAALRPALGAAAVDPRVVLHEN